MDWQQLVLIPVLTIAVGEIRYWARPILTRLFGDVGVKPPANADSSGTVEPPEG